MPGEAALLLERGAACSEVSGCRLQRRPRRRGARGRSRQLLQ